MAASEDGIPHDFPWDDCRMLYSNPDGFAVKVLHGRSDQDYQFLVRSAFVDAKSIMSEWLKLHSHPADERLKNIIYHNCDYHFLARIYHRVSMLPGEQYFLLISILFFSQCKHMNALVLAERFFSTHELIHQKKINPININAPDLSWVDMAELLADSLDEIRPKIESHLPPGTLPKAAENDNSKQNKKRKRYEEEIPPVQPEPPQRQRRTRIANTNSDYEYDIPQKSVPANNNNDNANSSNNSNSSATNPTISAFEKAFNANNSRSDKDKQPYFVVPQSLAELLQQSISESSIVNVTEDDRMLHIRPLPHHASNSTSNGNKMNKSISQRPMYSNLTGQKMRKPKLTGNVSNNAMMRSHASTDSLSGYNRSPQKIGVADDSAVSTDNLSASQDTNSVGNKHTNPFYARDMDAVSISRGSAYYSHGNKSHLIVPNAYNLSQLQCDAGLDTGYQMMDSNNNVMFTATSTVARRQKKNKKLFHVLLLDMENWQGHYSGGCSAAASSNKNHQNPNNAINSASNVINTGTSNSQDNSNINIIKPTVPLYHNIDKNMANKMDNVPVLDISDPLSIKGVVALASHRFRIQLNAFQNEKRKFSRNCNDLYEAMWIFEVTLLISDGSKTLEGQLKIGNYLPMCQLGHRFQVYANPLEYFFELARQVTGFLHRAEVFPEDLIHLAVSYLDNMTMGPKELMSEEELNMSEELFALQNPVLLPIWRPIADCFRENHRLKLVKEVLNEVSQGTITSILQLFADPATPPLFRIPKLIIQPVVDPNNNNNNDNNNDITNMEDNDGGILAQGDSHNGAEDNMDNSNNNINDSEEGSHTVVKQEQPSKSFTISTTNNVMTVNMNTESHRKPAMPRVKKPKPPTYGSVSGLMFNQHPSAVTTAANGVTGNSSAVPHQLLLSQNATNSAVSMSSINETVMTTDSSVVLLAATHPNTVNKTSIMTDENAAATETPSNNTTLNDITSNTTSNATMVPPPTQGSGGVIDHSGYNLSDTGTNEAYSPRLHSLEPKISNNNTSNDTNNDTNNSNNTCTTIVKPPGGTVKMTLSPFQLLPNSTLIDTSNINCNNNNTSNSVNCQSKTLIPLSHPSKIPPTAKTAGVKFNEIKKRRRKSKEANASDSVIVNTSGNDTVANNNINNNNGYDYFHDTEAAVSSAPSTAFSTSLSTSVSTSDSTTERDTQAAALTLANILATASTTSNYK